MATAHLTPPLSTRVVIAILLAALVATSLGAGYYHARYTDLLKQLNPTSSVSQSHLLG